MGGAGHSICSTGIREVPWFEVVDAEITDISSIERRNGGNE